MESIGIVSPGAANWGRNNRLREIEANAIVNSTTVILNDLNDLGVLLLFSVFEATVRERVLADVATELLTLRHPALLSAADNLTEALKHGSFYKVTEVYKSLDPNLIEEVNQVRKYRNWVAHGRPGEPDNVVDPRVARDRLQRFLDLLTGTVPSP